MGSRTVFVGGLAVVLASAGIAIAGGTGAEENVAAVDGKITPSKLSKKKFKPVASFLGVRNSKDHIDGMQSNPASERLSFSNIKVNLSKAPRCNAALPNGSTPQFAKNQCPAKSFLGSGEAEVTAAGPTVIAEPVVSVFNGPGKNQVRLHTYDPGLGTASPIVNGKIVSAPGAKWGQALKVANAPETGGVMITKFNAKLMKKRKVVTARCKPKKIQYQRKVTYKDGSKETVTKSQKCKVKR